MTVIFALVGAVAGLFLFDFEFEGLWTGAVIGALTGMLLNVRAHVREIRNDLAETNEKLKLLGETVRRAAKKAVSLEAELSGPPPAETPAAEPEASETALAQLGKREPTTPAEEIAREPVMPEPERVVARPIDPARRREVYVPERDEAADDTRGQWQTSGPAFADKVVEAIRRWFTTGNVPVKIGVIVSLFGVAFLIKEAVDRGLLVFPLELRLICVALFGLVLLLIGWRLREKRPVYALSVQGGGVAIIYLTIYGAFALYGLLPALPAFALLVMVTAAAGALAVLQDSRALAVLAIAGGFMAPILASTGEGNHVILFSYYGVLNAAVFGVSWFKAWRLLNLLGFLFTFVIGTAWGYLAYHPDRFTTTEPFLVIFVLMYTIIPVLFASRERPNLKGWVDGTLVFGTPLVGFGLQTQLVGDTEFGLAISAVALAGLYVSIATYLFRKASPELRVLTESFWSLSIVFLAIAVPLALNARWTSLAWSVQGAAMVWLGRRQDRRLALIAGVLLQAGAGVAFVSQPAFAQGEIVIVNGYFLGALMLAAAGLFSSRIFDRLADTRHRDYAPTGAWVFLVWGAAWWLSAGFLEIDRFVPAAFELNSSLTFVAATIWLAMFVANKLAWPRLESIGLLIVPAMLMTFVYGFVDLPHPLARLGWLAWPAALATHYGLLRLREVRVPMIMRQMHAAGYWLLVGVIATELYWWFDLWTDGIWAVAGTMAAITAMSIATIYAPQRLAWPTAIHRATYVFVGAGANLCVLGVTTFIVNVGSPGSPEPLPYIPLLNPLELVSIFVFFAAYLWLREVRREFPRASVSDTEKIITPALFVLFLLTMIVARTVHHWANVPFDPQSLAASNVLQASLSIVWSCAGLAAMVFGARSGRRMIWMVGAALMAIVVVKLFLVELGNTGTVTRVVSFLGVGILLLIVGYFAPVPPRDLKAA